MTASFCPNLVFRVKDRSDRPAVRGQVFCYTAGGPNVPLATYQDVNETIENTHPVVLNSRGECKLKLIDGRAYFIQVFDYHGNLIHTEDNVTSTGTGHDIEVATLQSAYDNGNTIDTTDSDPVVITKGNPFQQYSLDYDGSLVQYNGQSSEHRLSATEVLRSESATDGVNGTSFHQEKLQKDYYSDEINVNSFGYENNRKHTESYAEIIDTDTLKVSSVVRASDKTTKDTFNFKREASLRNSADTNHIDLYEQYSLNGYKKNVLYTYNNTETNEDELYQTIGQTNRTRTIAGTSGASTIEDAQLSYQILKKDDVDYSSHHSDNDVTQYNNAVSHTRKVTDKVSGAVTAIFENVYDESLSSVFSLGGKTVNARTSTSLYSEDLVLSPDNSKQASLRSDNTKSELNLKDNAVVKVGLSTSAQNILANGVIAEKAIGSTEQACVDNGGSPRSIVCDCFNGQNFFYQTVGTDALGFSMVGTQAGFEYSVRLDLAGGVPSAITWPVNAEWLGTEPIWKAENYIIKAHYGDDSVIYLSTEAADDIYVPLVSTSHVYKIAEFAGADLGEKLIAAIAYVEAGATIDCTSIDGVVLEINDTIDIDKPLTIMAPLEEVACTVTGDLFNILSDRVSIIGGGRSTRSGALIQTSRFRMLDGRYHIYSRGHNVLKFYGMDLIGVKSSGEPKDSGRILDGHGGIYVEKANPGTTSGGNNSNDIIIEEILIDGTFAHGVYIDTPILSALKGVRISGCAGHAFFLWGGTSTTFTNCYVSQADYAGFMLYQHTYGALIGCAAEYSGVGYWFRSSYAITTHGSGAEYNTNRGSLVYSLGLTTTDDIGGTFNIPDISSDYLNLFRGHSIAITGGQSINVNAFKSANPGRPHPVSGVSTTTRHIYVNGNARDIAFQEPSLSTSSGETYPGRFDIEVTKLSTLTPDGVRFCYNPELGDVTPVIEDYITSINDSAHSTYILSEAESLLVESGNERWLERENDFKINGMITNTKVAGVVTYPAPEISVDGSYNISMPEIEVNLWKDVDYDTSVHTYKIPAVTGLVTIDGGDQCIVADYNGGNPIYRIINMESEDWNNSTIIPVVDVWRVGTTIHSNSYDSIALGTSEKIVERLTHVRKYVRENGLGISESATPSARTIALTAGQVYSGVIEVDILAFSSSVNQLTRINRNGSGVWVYSDEPVYNNTQYDSPTGLVTSGPSKWLVRWYYRSIGDEIDMFYMLGTTQYNSQALAELASPPDATQVPNIISKHCILVGRSVVQYNTANGFTVPFFQETTATTSVAGSSVFTDNLFRITDELDTTKKVAFEVSGVSTATTRTLTVPNASGTLALTNVAQTFSADQTFNATAYFNGPIIQNGAAYETHAEQVFTTKDTIILRDGAISGLGTGYAGLTAKLYDDVNDGNMIIKADGFFRVGDVGNEVIVAGRDDTIVDRSIPFWDNNTFTLRQSLLKSNTSNELEFTGGKFKTPATFEIYEDGTFVKRQAFLGKGAGSGGFLQLYDSAGTSTLIARGYEVSGTQMLLTGGLAVGASTVTGSEKLYVSGGDIVIGNEESGSFGLLVRGLWPASSLYSLALKPGSTLKNWDLTASSSSEHTLNIVNSGTGAFDVNVGGRITSTTAAIGATAMSGAEKLYVNGFTKTEDYIEATSRYVIDKYYTSFIARPGNSGEGGLYIGAIGASNSMLANGNFYSYSGLHTPKYTSANLLALNGDSFLFKANTGLTVDVDYTPTTVFAISSTKAYSNVPVSIGATAVTGAEKLYVNGGDIVIGNAESETNGLIVRGLWPASSLYALVLKPGSTLRNWDLAASSSSEHTLNIVNSGTGTFDVNIGGQLNARHIVSAETADVSNYMEISAPTGRGTGLVLQENGTNRWFMQYRPDLSQARFVNSALSSQSQLSLNNDGSTQFYLGNVGCNVSLSVGASAVTGSEALYVNGTSKFSNQITLDNGSSGTKLAIQHGGTEIASLGYSSTFGGYLILENDASATGLTLRGYGTSFFNDSVAIGATAVTGTEKLYVNGSTILNGDVKLGTNAIAKHLEFSRSGINYIAAPTGGSFAFIPDGASVALANSALTINTDKSVDFGGNVVLLNEGTVYSHQITGNYSAATWYTVVPSGVGAGEVFDFAIKGVISGETRVTRGSIGIKTTGGGATLVAANFTAAMDITMIADSRVSGGALQVQFNDAMTSAVGNFTKVV